MSLVFRNCFTQICLSAIQVWRGICARRSVSRLSLMKESPFFRVYNAGETAEMLLLQCDLFTISSNKTQMYYHLFDTQQLLFFPTKERRKKKHSGGFCEKKKRKEKKTTFPLSTKTEQIYVLVSQCSHQREQQTRCEPGGGRIEQAPAATLQTALLFHTLHSCDIFPQHTWVIHSRCKIKTIK